MSISSSIFSFLCHYLFRFNAHRWHIWLYIQTTFNSLMFRCLVASTPRSLRQPIGDTPISTIVYRRSINLGRLTSLCNRLNNVRHHYIWTKFIKSRVTLSRPRDNLQTNHPVPILKGIFACLVDPFHHRSPAVQFCWLRCALLSYWVFKGMGRKA